ncbi:FSD1 isoform 6, partial [Pan troglodytes]
MEEQREALRKIIKTLAVKNEEIQSFIYSLKQMLLNVEANSAKVRYEPDSKAFGVGVAYRSLGRFE